MPTYRYLLLAATLFSLYCYTLELERLGRALLGPDSERGLRNGQG